MVDLNKKISFGELFKKDQSTQWPTKTTMNLAQSETTQLTPTQWLIPLIVIVVILALFIKFGIYDQFAMVSRQQRQTSQINQQLSTLNAQLTNYDKVAEEYKMYSSGYLSAEEAALVDPVDALNIIEQYIMPVANVSGIQYSENVMTVNFDGLTLAHVGELMTQIQALPQVGSANVYTAGSETDSNVTASAVITLQKASNGGVA